MAPRHSSGWAGFVGLRARARGIVPGIRFAIVLFAIALIAPPSAFCSPQDLAGHWEGTITLHDTPLSVRIDVSGSAEHPTATLDIPSLVYAWEPIPAASAENGILLTLPFGLGSGKLSLTDQDRLEGLAGKAVVALRRGAAFPLTKTELTIHSNDFDLPATLYEKTGATRSPGIVISAGSSGDRAKWPTRSWCDFFVRRGMACLVYDRRPEVSASGKPSTLQQDSDDLKAVLTGFASRPEIISSKVGIFGRSRGVWIALRASRDNPTVHFLVLGGAPATTPAEQELISVVGLMRAEGRSETEISSARDYYRLYFHVAHSGQDWPELESLAKFAQSVKWGEYVDQPSALSDLAWWGSNADFDTRDDACAVTVPTLAFWGSDDKVTPPAVHKPLLEAQLGASKSPSVTIRIFAGGDHRGESKPGNEAAGKWQWFGMAPGLLDSLAEWITAHVMQNP